MALERGVLVVRDTGKGTAPRVQVRIGDKTFSPAQGEVSQSLLDRLQELNGKEVEFERVGGQPKKVREVGGAFVSPRTLSREVDRGSRASHVRGGFRPPQPQRRQDSRERNIPQGRPDFHNPYNFVPAPPRNTDDPDFGDQPPVRQDVFDPQRHTGRIRVRMIAKTPLLVPDTERVQESNSGHKTYPLRVAADGKPLIPASSVRGMLRSAYETITNSRFSRFSQKQHGDRLAFRMDAGEGLKLIPARVENAQIRLLTGSSGVGTEGKPNGPMYAAWLPRYDRNGQIANWAVRYSDAILPEHGDEAVCWIEWIQHSSPDFEFWRVRSIARGTDMYQLGNQPAPSQSRGKSAPKSSAQMKKVCGWVCVTNANINRKHDERVFFVDSGSQVPGPFPLTEAHRSKWSELIQNYQSIHEDDLRKRRDRKYDQYLGPEPGQTAWSRYVYTEDDRHLRNGTLCYVRLNADQPDVEALFPVMIARELYSVSPWDLLPESQRPATRIDQLSPADRVFGWVRLDAGTDAGRQSRDEPAAARGLLRVGPVTCGSSVADAVESFQPPGVPLAILSTPKPQQGRFYVAKTPKGEAQDDGLSKVNAGYSAGKGLRGRKVYPHQRSLPDDHWGNPTEDCTQQGTGQSGHYQEYRRPQKNGQDQYDDQNRSILGWVKPGAEFTFELHVHNLSKVELGALLWLLKLHDDHSFRFGTGKPLGFGSVRLTTDEFYVRTGEDVRARYTAWHTKPSPADPDEAAIQAFKEALCRAYPPPTQGGDFDNISFIKAFLVACRGFKDNLPIHYPRATEDGRSGPPSPEGESFRWFVANEKEIARYSLRDLSNEDGLPTLRDPSVDSQGGRRPRGRR